MIGSAEIEEMLAEHAEAQAAAGSEPQPGATWPVLADAPPNAAVPSAPPRAWCWDPFALLPRGTG